MSDAHTWPRKPSDPVVEMQLPRHYGSVPTLFGAPRAEVPDDLQRADIVFLGVPWQAPVPDSRMGAAGASYFGTNLTPSTFRTNIGLSTGVICRRWMSMSSNACICSITATLKFQTTTRPPFGHTVERIGEIMRSGAMAFTGRWKLRTGNLRCAGRYRASRRGPVAVINFDAHHDNLTGEIVDDDSRLPRWGLPGHAASSICRTSIRRAIRILGCVDRATIAMSSSASSPKASTERTSTHSGNLRVRDVPEALTSGYARPSPSRSRVQVASGWRSIQTCST